MHSQDERIKWPSVPIQMIDLHIDSRSHICNFNFEYVIGYLNARLHIHCGEISLKTCLSDRVDNAFPFDFI